MNSGSYTFGNPTNTHVGTQASGISRAIEEYTASISSFDTRRDYLSLSHIAQDEGELIRMYKEGFTDSLKIRLKCYKGYQIERDLVARILKAFPERAQAPFPEIWFETNGIKVAAHPDLMFDGYPADVKSVPLDEHLPKDGKLPRKVYWQLQADMLYAPADKALAIYESRESGAIRDYWVKPNRSIEDQIHTKIEYVTRELAMWQKGGRT